MMKIALVGGGNMGEAILTAVLNKGLTTPELINVGEVREERRQYLKNQYGVVVIGSNREAASGKDVVVLAIKPQNLVEVMAELKGCFEPTQLVLSIIAGARISTLCQGLGYGRVIRAMPNTPAQVGLGISAWTATAEVSAAQKDWSRAILEAMGKELYFDDEQYLDMATAVSGSGPAYFFLLAESMVESAVHIGLPHNEAEELVLQTMIGSAHLLQKSGNSPAELRRNVTSPGGTTAEALKVFEQGDFTDLVKKAVRAAYHRAIELGN